MHCDSTNHNENPAHTSWPAARPPRRSRDILDGLNNTDVWVDAHPLVAR